MSAAYLETFSGKGTKIWHIFKRIFSGRIILKHIENKKKALEGPEACFPGKFLKMYML